ncbi:hypothetical protein LJK88_46165 [Paenibacillus sp. P26]|nr:hypothetical protein LJK88_46165 [Paenibacillus sp. P26]
MLKAYIESNLAFLEGNRNHIVALAEIVTNARTADGKPASRAPRKSRFWSP